MASVVALGAGGDGGAVPFAAPPSATAVVTTSTTSTTSTTESLTTSGPVAGSAAATGPEPSAQPTTTPPTTLALSPLNSLVGTSVPVLPIPPSGAPAPLRITIDSMAVSVPVRAVGLELDGQLEIPDETEVGWYRLGSAPTEAGSTVLAGHVSWNRVDGPFRDLETLEPGATVRLDLDDGSTRQYVVTERTQYPKLELPADRIWASSGPETLVLITCGGDFNPEIRRYRDNIVVYAVPVG